MSASQCGYVGIGREASDETKIARSFARSMGVTGEILRAVAPSLNSPSFSLLLGPQTSPWPPQLPVDG